MKKPVSRLPWLLAVMAVLVLLRWWAPPQAGSGPDDAQIVPAVARSRSAVPVDAGLPASSASGTEVATSRTGDIPVDLEGNAFPVRVVRQPEPPPPPPEPPPSRRRVAKVEAPPPEPPAPPPPPPPPPAVEVIGTWDDHMAPGVFVATAQGTVLARPGTVLLGDYRVTEITAQQMSIMQVSTRQVWQLPVPQVTAHR